VLPPINFAPKLRKSAVADFFLLVFWFIAKGYGAIRLRTISPPTCRRWTLSFGLSGDLITALPKGSPRPGHEFRAATFLGKFFEWRSALVLVKPETLIGWHRKGFRLFWCWKSRPRGRPKLPVDLQQLIRNMGADNPTWGEARIADELQLKLGIRVSPRTIRKYPSSSSSGRTPDPAQRWLTFVRNHAQAIVACDFFVVVTATFRVLYVFVIIEIGTRRIVPV